MPDPTPFVNAGPAAAGDSSSGIDGEIPLIVADSHQSTERFESQLRVLAATVELISSLDAVVSLDEAAEESAAALNGFLESERVIILWRLRGRGPLQVIGDSARLTVTDDDKRIDHLLLAAGEEIASRGSTTSLPASGSHDRHALLAVGQLASALSIDSIYGVGLCNQSGADRGVVIVAGGENPEVLERLRLFSSPLASRLAGVEMNEPSRIELISRNIVQVMRSRRRFAIAWALAALAAVMLVPLRYRISADLELQPTEYRFVAVPFDGPLKSAHVQPGDEVAENDLLARINPREIEYELAGVRADLNRSLQEKKGLMVEHDAAGSKIAALESERLRLQSELLKYRRGNLEIRSPIAGVVVSGDHRQSEGMPMSRGDTLFEIAPLGRMRVEIAVPEDDFSYVGTGMPVSFYLHAMPSRKISGVISRVHPRAELRDHENVFIAEVDIVDPDNVLRPGMRGRAKITGARHTLGWNLFHKSFYALRNLVGW